MKINDIFISGAVESSLVRSVADREIGSDFELYKYCRDYFNSVCDRVVGTGSTSERNFYSEDFFQEAFIQIWTEIENGRIFVEGRKIFRKDKLGTPFCMRCSIRTFLLSIIRNMNAQSRRKISVEIPENIISYDQFRTMESCIDEHLRLQVVDDCVLNLPPRCKSVLTMFYYEGKSLDEILVIRGENTSKDGLKTGKYKCMQKLKSDILTKWNKILKTS